MTTNPNPLTWRIGLIGYGEVGRILAEDLRQRGVFVSACDIKLGSDEQTPLVDHAQHIGVDLYASHAALAHVSDLLICAVTADQTLAAVKACESNLFDTLFLDLNSASPWVKRRAGEYVEKAGGRYLEGAVMTSLPPHRIAVPMLLGGPYAKDQLDTLTRLGFSPKVVDGDTGQASATKMCRSIMIKGLEAILIESLSSARHYGVESAVLDSLKETFPGIDWEKQATYMFSRVIAHGRRRAEEMREVARTVSEAGLTPWSAEATTERQSWMADLADSGHFGNRESNAFATSSDWRTEADRILATVQNVKT
jgi:3-hydroxyisobutyrate dehydrogenase-like beta-hydroxyacid dehydrogenase